MKRKIMDDLITWKNKQSGRSPLLLSGIRQVGKTSLLYDFGKNYYRNVAYFNLDSGRAAALCFTVSNDPKHILDLLKTECGEQIIPGETLIILDNIQSCSHALASLINFKKSAPEFHIIGTGSLIDVICNRELYTFTAGNTEVMTLFPLDFEEFLWALGEEDLCISVRKAFETGKAMPAALHIKALDLFKRYLVTGGMPGAVQKYLETNDLAAVPDVQRRISNDCIADISRYALKKERAKALAVYESVPLQLQRKNMKFQYKPVQTGGTAAVFDTSVEWLCSTGAVLKCNRLEHAHKPIPAYRDHSSFKLFLSDVGLLTMQSGVSYQAVLREDEGAGIQTGHLYENYVAQALAGKQYDLFYWTSEGIAEVSFVLRKKADIIPVEVRSGSRHKARSLNLFMARYKPAYSIRISTKNFSSKNNTRHIPFYAVFCI